MKGSHLRSPSLDGIKIHSTIRSRCHHRIAAAPKKMTKTLSQMFDVLNFVGICLIYVISHH